MSLTGKSIIVTGGAAGLGLAIAKALSGAGASITICDISYESVKSVQAANASFVVVEADVFYIADVEKVFHAAKCRFGNVDGLVNNAGVMDRFDPVGEVSSELWNRVIATNLTGAMEASKIAVKQFMKQHTEGRVIEGVIINVASPVVDKPLLAGVAYAASKAGLVALTKHTAAFYASEAIRCNAIIPGVMYTKMLDHVDEGDFNAEGFKKAEAGHALSRMCSLDAVAELVVFLFNSKAHTINGAIIAADGGFSAG